MVGTGAIPDPIAHRGKDAAPCHAQTRDRVGKIADGGTRVATSRQAILPTLRARLGQGTSGACTRYAGSSPIFLMMGSAGSDERNFTSAAAACRSFALAGVAVA